MIVGDPRFVAPTGDYERLQDAEPRDILRWACDTIDRLAVATSFQSSGLVILHVLKDIRPDFPVLFLDTGFHFEETIAFKRQIAAAWDLKVVDLNGSHGGPGRQEEIYGPELYRRDPDRCCFINKVEPLQRALEEFDAWISGIRRDQSPLRAHTPVLEAQMLPSGREVLKIHPLATWTRADVDAYVARHEIPTNPLLEEGYASIGCRPCTRRTSDGEDERAGRWDGFAKTECGIHSFGKRTTEAET
jgi:phosphoadenosine phosphosulfate reductase